MAEAATLPARKRAVPAARPKPKPRTKRVAPIIDDEPITPNYALRVMDAPEDTFSASLSKALEAISARAAEADIPETEAACSKTNWLGALDKLPPIKLPVGPAIPWRVGLPMLAALVIVMGVMTRAGGSVQQPRTLQQAGTVQQEVPLFATATPVTQDQPVAQQQIGVSDTAAINFDLVGIGVKLLAVLGLAYASMLLLKRVGVGGSRPGARAAGSALEMVSSIALAPNRSIHVIRVPGGKALLVGATPNTVNLLADLGELPDD